MSRPTLFQQMRRAQVCALPLTADEVGTVGLLVRLFTVCWATALRAGVITGLVLAALIFAGTAVVDRHVLAAPLDGVYTVLGLSLVHVAFGVVAGLVCGGGLAVSMLLRRQVWHRRYLAAACAGMVVTLWGWALTALAWAEWPDAAGEAARTWDKTLVTAGAALMAVWAGRTVTRCVALWRTWGLAPPLAPLRRRSRTLAHAVVLLAILAVAAWHANSGRAFGMPRRDERAAEALHVLPDRHVVVLGIDGLGWDAARAGIGDGSLKNWDAIERVGGRGRLRSAADAGPAAFWLTVATGAPARDHGALELQHARVAGAAQPLALGHRAYGLAPLYHTVFGRSALAIMTPVSRQSLRRWCAWEVVRQAGGEAGVIGWWGAWPGSGEAGTLDMPALMRAGPARAAPLDLDARVGEGLRAALHRSPRPTLTMAYFPGLDLLQRETRGRAAAHQVLAHRRFLDALIGEAAATLGPEDLLLVVGDPGGRHARQPVTDARDEMDGGVVLAAGTALAPATRLARPHVVDVWPTVAWWVGLPAAAEWPGQAWTELRPDHARTESIATYGRPAPRAPLDNASAALRARQFREAGYLH